jgi:hypothetical protein
MNPELKEAVEAAVARLKAGLEPWDAGCEYLNFSERCRAPKRFFNGSSERLAAVKAAIDPRNTIRSNHPVD